MKFVWDDKYEAAIRELKHKFTTTPVLALPAERGEFIIYNDAFRQGI